MQADPIKPTLKPTGTKRLKVKCDILLSTSALKIDLRRYNEAHATGDAGIEHGGVAFDKVGRCRSTLSNSS